MLNDDDLPPWLRRHYPASTLLRGSPPLSGASVLSASRLEPLAPCMGLFLSSSFGTPAHLLSFISFFVRSESRSFVPTAQELSRLAVAPTSWHASALARPHLDGFEHDGTLGAIGMTIRGEPAFGRGSIAPQPCIRWVQGPEP